MESEQDREPLRKVIALGGGKGGIGKTVISASLAAGIAMLNKKTVIIDADLGGSNLHTVCGINKPAYSLRDFFEGKKTFEEILIDHAEIENLQILCGASGSFGMANLKYLQKLKLIRTIKRLDFDYIILDLGAGTSYNVLDLFLTADMGIVMVNPDPLSVLEGYNFIKQVFYRNMFRQLKKHAESFEVIKNNAKFETFKKSTNINDLLSKLEALDQSAVEVVHNFLQDFHPMLMINKVEDKEDELNGLAVEAATQDLLSLNMEYIGCVHSDKAIKKSVEDGCPFIFNKPNAKASRDLSKIIILKILNRNVVKAIFERESLRRRLPRKESITSNTTFCSIQCIYWEECPYRKGGYPCKMSHLKSVEGFHAPETEGDWAAQ